MDQDIPIMDSNLFELEEENEVKKIDSKPSQIPIRHLRNIKKVNYSKFFSEDPDNSEEYIDPEEHKQKNESVKKRQRPKSVLKSEHDADTNKKKKRRKSTRHRA